MEPLTERQQQVLDYITDYLDNYACPPTLREISGHISAKGTVTAIRHLDELERKGYIKRREGSSRSISIVGRGSTVSIPIIGRVKAGPPSLAYEDIEGYCSLDINWADKGCFFLRVSGNSMIEDHILDGDLALIKPQNTADNNDIVVAMINGEDATLKRFYLEDSGRFVRLESRNPEYPSYVITADTVTIIGKLMKTIRNYS